LISSLLAALEKGPIQAVVKPNAKKTEVLEWLDDHTVKIAIAAPAEENKANVELVRFLSKQVKRRVRIKSGLTSKRKVVELV